MLTISVMYWAYKIFSLTVFTKAIWYKPKLHVLHLYFKLIKLFPINKMSDFKVRSNVLCHHHHITHAC